VSGAVWGGSGGVSVGCAGREPCGIIPNFSGAWRGACYILDDCTNL